MPPPPDDRPARRMLALRYGLPGLVVAVGLVAVILDPSLAGLEALALALGVGGSILLLNVLYRVGVSGDRERDREEAAREHLDLHGRWPDEDD